VIHRICRLGMINAYLVHEDDGLTLIDTLIFRSAGAILAAAGTIGRPIVRIAITHAHWDHTGSIDALHGLLPEAELSTSARDAKLLRRDRSPDPGEQPQKRFRGPMARVRTAPTRLLHDGDTVGSLQVVAAPGHSPGQVAFLDPRDRTLYCGDAYTNIGGLATTARPGSWYFGSPALVSWDRPTALRSAQTLRDLDPARLAPGHGKVVESPGAAMDAAIARGV
jgi:glyoxylase-like metal-dependent hydrolase (beta-lactamase superfamily II)